MPADEFGYLRGVNLHHSAPLRWVALVLLFTAAGCGARTELEDTPIPRSGVGRKPKPAPTAGATPTPPPQPTPVKPSNTGAPNDPIGTDNTLGDCKLGTVPAPGRACPYVAQNRCYSDSNSACACICPRNAGDTTCAEGFFPNANGAIEVNCFTL